MTLLVNSTRYFGARHNWENFLQTMADDAVTIPFALA
jgi:hypothetical protein